MRFVLRRTGFFNPESEPRVSACSKLCNLSLQIFYDGLLGLGSFDRLLVRCLKGVDVGLQRINLLGQSSHARVNFDPVVPAYCLGECVVVVSHCRS